MGIGLIVTGILALLGILLIVILVVGIAVYRRSLSEGVVYSDGIDADEMKLIKDILEEETKADQLRKEAEKYRKILSKIQSAIANKIDKPDQD